MRCHQQTIRSARRGLTLIEVLLVLVILVMAASIIGANLHGPIENQRVKKSAQIIEGTWAQARIDAIRADRPFVFVHAINGPQYLVKPWVDDAAFMDEMDETDLDDTFDPYSEKFRTRGTLPEGVTFAHFTRIEDDRARLLAPYAEVEPDADTDDSVEWSRPIFFYPDGTSGSAAVTLTNDREFAITLRLRGLTGATTIGQLRRTEAAEQEMMDIEQE